MMKKKVLTGVASAALVAAGILAFPLTAQATDETPAFEGVTAYTPERTVTCDGASWSHPEFQYPDGTEVTTYLVRSGTSQADAQAKDWQDYTPGEVISTTFEDSTVSNQLYVELRAKSTKFPNGHQLGQSRINSTPCEVVPEKPEIATGDEQRTIVSECTVPLDGTKVEELQNRVWTQDWILEDNVWVAGERVFGDWEVVATTTIESEECEPEETVVPPVDETEVPEVPEVPAEIEEVVNTTPLPMAPERVETAALANTGSNYSPLLMASGIAILAGVALTVGRVLRVRSVK